VAKYVGLEPHYISALFQKEVHISPKDFIRKRKLKEAKRLLTRTNYTVTQVAEVLGFCDTPHFTKCFKNEYDVLPSILRKRDMKRKTPIENNANIVKS
jgi:AraC-like DNA-binding protein